MKLRFLAGLLLLASQVCQAQAAPDKLLSKFMVQVPYGVSYVDYKLIQPTVLNPIRVVYTRQPSCPILPATAVSVKYAGIPGWQQTQYQNFGYFQHSNRQVTDIRFTLSQYSYRFENCELNILTKAKVPQKEVYAGYLSYEGGFVRNHEVVLINNFKSDKVRFDVPDFCRNLEFMDVRLRTDEAQLLALRKTGRFTFELGQGQNFSAIYVTMNGPKEGCDIPVYVTEDAD